MPSVDSASEVCPTCDRPLVKGCLHCAMLAALDAATLSAAEGKDLPAVDATFASFADPVLPTTVGHFRLLARLGAGGMGTVYEAEDTKLGRTVALKMIRASRFASAEEKARFNREAAAAAQLDHESIVPLYEVGEVEGHAFLVMKLVRGGTLADRIKAGPMSPVEAARLLSAVAAAVQHAHEKGVLHRDLKPSNVLLDEAGDPWLTDFGMARMMGDDTDLTTTAAQIGTPQYMSPEQAAGRAREVSAASDVWALGAVFYQMLSGKAPYAGETSLAIMHAVTNEDPPKLMAKDRRERELAVLVDRCLQKDASQRLSSAGMLAEELERWLREEPIQSRAARKWSIWSWLTAAMAMAAMGVIGWSFFRSTPVGLTIVEEQRVMPPAGMEEAIFGRAVALDGDTMAIGAPLQGAGAVNVYGRVDGRWVRQAILTPSDGRGGDEFGRAVAIEGDTLVVGAHLADSAARNSGAAYVFTREGAEWRQTAMLKAAAPGAGDGFGRAVAVDAGTVVIGSRLEDHNTLRDAGAAYVFVREGLSWKQQARLASPLPGAMHLFGISACIEGDTLIVGADAEENLAVPQSFIIERQLNSGAAYVFTRAAGVWTLQTRLAAAAGYGGCFGYSVALSGDTALIGCYRNNRSTADLDAAPDTSALESGAAFVFVREGQSWQQQAFLKPQNNRAGNRFGFQVALQGSTAVIGAYTESSGTTGINSSPDAACAEAGAAYVFQRQAARWSQTNYVKASYTSAYDRLGISLALDGQTLVVGASGANREPFVDGQVWTFSVK